MAIIVFVAFEIGICPRYSRKSDKIDYGTEGSSIYFVLKGKVSPEQEQG